MSGVEVAVVVLGVLPILIETLKAYDVARKKLEVFANYSREVGKIYDKLQVQQCAFDLGAKLLLSYATGSEEDAELMMEDLNHAMWLDSQGTGSKLLERLGKHASAALTLIKSMASQVQELVVCLAEFDILRSRKQQGESVKQAFRRLKSAGSLTFNKSTYDQQLKALKHDNENLRVIVSYMTSPQKTSSGGKRAVRSVPSSLTRTRYASLALHEALSESWSCANKDQSGHAVKLCLDAHVEDGVRLDLAISCSGGPTASSACVLSQPIWLYVRSLTHLPVSLSFPVDTGVGPSVGVTSQPVQKRVKASTVAAPAVNAEDLRGSPSVCDQLAKHCSSGQGNECLGYVESPQAILGHLRHHFYHRCTDSCAVQTRAQSWSLPEVLAQPPDIVTLEDQIRVALKVATAVLQLQSTPWLADQWRSSDLACFQASPSDKTGALSTLHVTSSFRDQKTLGPNDGRASRTSATLTTAQQAEQEKDQCLYGINNMILFSLGIALLEIGHRKPLEEFGTAQDPKVYTARRLAQKGVPLGGKYRSIAQRCLQCDFGAGDDLSTAELQGAVYGDVVCQLEDMLKGFSI